MSGMKKIVIVASVLSVAALCTFVGIEERRVHGAREKVAAEKYKNYIVNQLSDSIEMAIPESDVRIEWEEEKKCVTVFLSFQNEKKTITEDQETGIRNVIISQLGSDSEVQILVD